MDPGHGLLTALEHEVGLAVGRRLTFHTPTEDLRVETLRTLRIVGENLVPAERVAERTTLL